MQFFVERRIRQIGTSKGEDENLTLSSLSSMSTYLLKTLHYSKTCVKRSLSKRPHIQVQLSLNAGQNYCRMLQGEHSAILFTINKLPIVIKILILSIVERPFYTGFTVYPRDVKHVNK